MGMKATFWAGLCLIPGLWAPCLATAQKISDPESQLMAIRQALVEASLDKPTKVSATAWIDDQGQLHQTAHFQTDAKIRGIRVLSYSQDAQEELPRAQIQMEDLPWSVRMAKAEQGERCEPAPQQWRQPLVISSKIEAGFSGPELYASQHLLTQVENLAVRMAQQSRKWSVSQTPSTVMDTYHQHWLGKGEEPAGWHLQVQLIPVKSATPSWMSLDRWTPWAQGSSKTQWTLKATFGQRHVAAEPIQVIWQRQLFIDASDMARSHPDRWVKELLPQLEQKLALWVPQQAHGSNCDTVQFSVTRSGGQKWIIQAGLGSGLKVGDRVLVLNSSRLPGRLLEPGSTQQLAIAEVTRVGRHQSDLKPLAGTSNPGSGDWIALPL
jgi:hypothetical protein